MYKAFVKNFQVCIEKLRKCASGIEYLHSLTLPLQYERFMAAELGSFLLPAGRQVRPGVVIFCV